MVDVVDVALGISGMEPHEVLHRRHDVVVSKHGSGLLQRLLVELETQLLVDLVPTDPRQVVALRVEEQVVQ
jgi:hypothetical protein